MKITTNYLRQVIKEELDFVLKENENQKELDLLIQKLDRALKPFEKYLKLNEGFHIPFIDYIPDNAIEWTIFGYSFVKNWDSVKELLEELVRVGVLKEKTAEEINNYGEETKNEIEKIIDNRNILVRTPVKIIGSLGKYFSLFAAIPGMVAVVKAIYNIKSRVEAKKQLPAPGSSDIASDPLAKEIDATFADLKQTAEAEAPKAIKMAKDFAEQPEEVRAQAAEKWSF